MPATDQPAQESAGPSGYPGDVPGIRGEIANLRYILDEPCTRAYVYVATVCVAVLFTLWLVFDWTQLINPFFAGITAAYVVRLAARPTHRFAALTCVGSVRGDVVNVILGLITNAIWAVLTYLWH